MLIDILFLLSINLLHENYYINTQQQKKDGNFMQLIDRNSNYIDGLHMRDKVENIIRELLFDTIEFGIKYIRSINY